MIKCIFTAALMLTILAQTFLVAGTQDKSAPEKASPPDTPSAPSADKKPSDAKDAPKTMDKDKMKKDDKMMGKDKMKDKGPSIYDYIGPYLDKKDLTLPSDELSAAEIDRLIEMARDKGPLGDAARKQLREALQSIDKKGLLPTDDPFQDLIFLDDSRPVLVRVRTEVNGKSLSGLWNAFVTQLFRVGDINKDGFLTEKELALIPSMDQIASGGPNFFGGGRFGGAAWNFNSMDKNRDGKISLAEFAAYLRSNGMTPFQIEAPKDDDMGMRFRLGIVDREPSIEAVSDTIFNLLDTNRDGRISKEELAAAQQLLRLDSNEDEMLTTREIAPHARANSGKGAAGMNMMSKFGPRNAPAGNSKVILLKNGEAVKMDFNNNNNKVMSPYSSSMAMSSPGDKVVQPVDLMKPDTEPEISEVARRLQARYSRKGKQESTFLTEMIDDGLRSMGLAKVETEADRAKAMLLSRADIGLDEATFNWLDTNKDGRLDAKELARFGKRNPDVEFVVRLGNRGATLDRVEVVAWKPMATADNGMNVFKFNDFPDFGKDLDLIEPFLDPPPGAKIKPIDVAKPQPPIKIEKRKEGPVEVNGQKEYAMVNMGKTRAELRVKEGAKTNSMNNFGRQQSVALFKQADRDGKGYITEKDNNFFGQEMFKAMDRDGDGKVTEKEFFEYLDLVEDLQKKSKQACVTLVLSDESRGLFDLIDTNRDGKLSTRELRGAVKLLETLDKNGKGYITRADIPKTTRLTVRQGPSRGGEDSYEAQIAAVYGITLYDEEEYPTAGPAWFRKMDKNRDGDVSLAEWLGSEELFRQIDTDGDGLISLQEAEAYDAAQRRKK